nr:hypothetical protein Iba_chr12cCG22970 [Ipomoea batatas]
MRPAKLTTCVTSGGNISQFSFSSTNFSAYMFCRWKASPAKMKVFRSSYIVRN